MSTNLPGFDLNTGGIPLHQYSVSICRAGSVDFQSGQDVAQRMYRKVWNTPSYSSRGSYAVVVASRVTEAWHPVANVNFVLRETQSLLPSELIFGERNWASAGVDDESRIAEICGLAINDATPVEMRRGVLMMLSMGVQSIAMHTDIRWIITIQHEFLIRILRQSLGLPFRQIRQQMLTDAPLPKDDYWSRDVMPGLYLLDSHDPASRSACESFFYYLNGMQMTLQMTSCLNFSQRGYAGFRRQWQQRMSLAELS
jgi:hypothetical protein